VIVFDQAATMYSPSSINRILSAYGLTLTDASKLPTNFAKTVKQDGQEVTVFDGAACSYSASSMNQILSAYSHTDAAK
jgi:hypothetical protein